jgi:hypothetical protein
MAYPFLVSAAGKAAQIVREFFSKAFFSIATYEIR